MIRQNHLLVSQGDHLVDFWKEMAKEEVPPPPIVGGGMVRAFGVKKGNKGGGE